MRLIESPASHHELVGVGSVIEIRAVVPKRVAEGAVYRCAANAITFTDNQAVRAGENGGGVKGLGIAGIAYQFQRTQVGSVLATLWDVDDTATAALMRAFYERTREGQSFAEALAGAQRSLLRKPVDVLGTRHDHPAFWAPFVLMGTP